MTAAKTGRARMRRDPEHFAITAAAAGASRRSLPAAPVPVELMAAAPDPRGPDVAVRLDVGGAEVVAVIDGDGDPRQWWTAIWDVAWPAWEAPPTRASRVILPPGLSAVARGCRDEELSVYVSDALAPERQRAAVRMAVRASRGPGWRTLLPVRAAALLLPPRGSRSRRVTGLLRARLVTGVAASTVLAAAAAAVYLAVVPQHHYGAARSTGSGALGASGRDRTSGPAARRRASRHAGARARGPAPHRTPGAGTVARQPAPGTPTPGSRAPDPGPTSGSRPTPAPSVSPSPGSGHCTVLLVIPICTS